MDVTQAKGSGNEIRSMLKFIEDGYDCSVPFGNAAKYDFIADVNGHLYRMQNKCAKNPVRSDTGEIDYGSIMIHCVSQTTNTQKTIKHRYTKEQIDYFTTTFDGKTYVIPVEECSDTKTLRLTIPVSGVTNYNWAEDYLYENVIEKLVQGNYVSKSVEEVLKDNRARKSKNNCNKKFTKAEIKYHNSIRKVERPDKEKLTELIKTVSFCEIGRVYGVSDNTIRKWCRYYGLPSTKKELKNSI